MTFEAWVWLGIVLSSGAGYAAWLRRYMRTGRQLLATVASEPTVRRYKADEARNA